MRLERRSEIGRLGTTRLVRRTSLRYPASRSPARFWTAEERLMRFSMGYSAALGSPAFSANCVRYSAA